MGIAATSRDPIRSMELYINRFGNTVTRITRLHTDHGSSGPIHEDGTLYRSCDKCDGDRSR